MNEKRNPADERRSRAWLIVPMFLAGLLAASFGGAVRPPASPDTVASVIEEIHATVLRRAEEEGDYDGGKVGSWWIAAAAVNPESGELQHIRISGDGLEVAARRATLSVQADDDSFTLDLEDAVLTRLALPEDVEGRLLEVETHRLGPTPWGRPIEDDPRPAELSNRS